MEEIVRCKRCNAILKAKKSIELGYGRTCYRIHLLQEANKPKNTIDFEREIIILKDQIVMMGKYIRIQEITEPEPEQFDTIEMKSFIKLEIRRVLNGFSFSKTANTKDVGIVPNKITKMPVFNPLESNKRLVMKELKSELLKGISNVLHEVGSFDEQINFLEMPILA